MKTYIKRNFVLLFFVIFFQHNVSAEKIKIGLIVPLTGEYSKIGNSIVNSVRLAVNKIDNPNIEILPRDNGANPDLTYEVAKDLKNTHNVKIVIGPIFYRNNIYLNKLPEITFLSLSNKINNNYSNVISS